jgi:hypothetical protein
MFSRREILSHPSYWLNDMRMTVFRALSEYMDKGKGKGKITRKALAEELNCSPGYISQMLNGDTNASLEKLAEVCLAIGKVPRLRIEELDDVLVRDEKLSSGTHMKVSLSGTLHVVSQKEVPMQLSPLYKE